MYFNVPLEKVFRCWCLLLITISKAMGRAYVFASRGTLPLSELASCPNHSCWVIHISVELGYVISVWGANIPRACFGNLTEVRCGTHISHLQAGEPIELVVSWEKHMEWKEEVQSSGAGGALQEEQLESILWAHRRGMKRAHSCKVYILLCITGAAKRRAIKSTTEVAERRSKWL